MLKLWLIMKFGLTKAILITYGIKIGILFICVGVYFYFKSKE